MKEKEDIKKDEPINEEIVTEENNNEGEKETQEIIEECENTETCESEVSEASEVSDNDELDNLKEELESAKDKFLRLTAEYDNYRKRTIKEKEGIYSDAYIDVLKEIIPIIDNLERAIAADGNLEDLKKGIEMTIKGCQDSFAKLGVEEIDASGEFDPNVHNAVMHIEDENLGKNTIAEVFQKGYKKDDKIIRYSMVKVAN